MPPRKNTALIVIDMQRGILAIPGLARRSETDAALDATVVRIAGLIERARSTSLPVIYVQHDGELGHRLEPGSPGWPIRPELAPRVGESVIRKHASDAFFQTRLDGELAAANIARLIITGCMTQYCIDTTVRRAVSLGYDVVLPADGHMTVDAGALRFEQIIAHHNLLLDGFGAGAHEVRVCPSAEIQI